MAEKNMTQETEKDQIRPIGIIRSCYREKFGIPRQAGLVKDAPASLELFPEFAREEAVRELDGFSHVWIIFFFHQIRSESWSPMVRPPRLGGNKKVGVFASRSPVRPNPIGISAVELESIDTGSGRVILHLKGIDILDRTPVLDIKPYVPYSDSIPDAKGGFAPEIQQTGIEVVFSEQAAGVIVRNESKIPALKTIIEQMLQNDPRPAYYPSRATDPEKVFGARLFGFDVRWRVEGGTAFVTEIVWLKNETK